MRRVAAKDRLAGVRPGGAARDILPFMRLQTICCAAICVVASSAAQRGITAEDYFAFENISDAHIAPDGRQVVYTLTTVDKQKNRRDSSIWAVAVDGWRRGG